MFLYRKSGVYFARIAGGLEEEGAAELEELGASAVRPLYRAIRFEADPGTLYTVNYRSRLVTRVIAPLITFDCHSAKYLYKTARSLDWPSLLSTKSTFSVRATVSNSAIRHSKFAALRLKDAVADFFRESTGIRPSVDTVHPDVRIDLRIELNRATIGIDTSGGSLHRRGYRKSAGDAPMQETVAAAIVRQTGWKGDAPLHDPMCGSGTLLAEALLAGGFVPSAFLRASFGFENLPDFDRSLWRRVKEETDRHVRPVSAGTVSGSDLSPEAIRFARSNLSRIPGGSGVSLRAAPFSSLDGIRDSVIVCNPPYGVRLGDGTSAARLAKEFGDFLKRKCTGSTAYIYFGDRRLIKSIGLRPAWKRPLASGGLDGRLAKYEMY